MDTTSVPKGSVVVAVDGSEHAARALGWAAMVAVRERRPLLLAHALGNAIPYGYTSAVVDPGALSLAIHNEGKALVEEAAAKVRSDHPDVDLHTLCETGDAREMLIRLSEDAHLLAVGSRGRGPVRSLLLGSVAAAITRHAQCPVVVLRPDTESSRGGGVLVGVDGTDRSLPTVEFACRAASWLGVPVTVVYSFWEAGHTSHDDVLVPADEVGHEEERVLLSQIVAGLEEKYPDVEIRPQLAWGLVDKVLVGLARDRDLLVVGSRSHGAFAEAFFGSVATTMVEYAPCPVAIVPHTRG